MVLNLTPNRKWGLGGVVDVTGCAGSTCSHIHSRGVVPASRGDSNKGLRPSVYSRRSERNKSGKFGPGRWTKQGHASAWSEGSGRQWVLEGRLANGRLPALRFISEPSSRSLGRQWRQDKFWLDKWQQNWQNAAWLACFLKSSCWVPAWSQVEGHVAPTAGSERS